VTSSYNLFYAVLDHDEIAPVALDAECRNLNVDVVIGVSVNIALHY
jgi:hypothetical protein